MKVETEGSEGSQMVPEHILSARKEGGSRTAVEEGTLWDRESMKSPSPWVPSREVDYCTRKP